ncbi:MAG: hypothetical protein E6H02_10235 [Bacillati bacterium ANGP1]|uniref:Uncharacterized protein n=1 Tax=Candidatus Segetimicrobium genomatis TaxID=2569760 RepID=A0A537LKQ9_9BACT|nr:MAG: hypothetical protein E6H02_10235 [Terrabacteria group bacterium ANGP1]
MVVVVEILLIHFKTRADIFNRTFSVLLYVFLAYLAGEAVVVLSLVLSAVLCRWGTVRLQRAAWLHDPFGTGALAFFAGVWFSAGVLIFREVTGLME